VEFVSECLEISQRFSDNLARIEDGQRDPEIINNLYRDMHTMKGSSQLFGFEQIAHLAHAIETSLGRFRDAKDAISPRLVEKLYECLDILNEIVEQISSLGGEPNVRDKLLALVPALLDNGNRDGEYRVPRDTPPLPASANPLPGEPKAAPEPPKVAQLDPSRVASGVAPIGKRPEHIEAAGPDEAQHQHDSTTTIRVQVALLDKLMNLVGEIVLVRNQVLQYCSLADDIELTKLSQKLDLVTGELQGEVMQTRMQPIGSVLSKFQRLIRDMARDLGKKIDLKLEGTETELDKTLLEAIKDPLTHLIRNACDHGIDQPEARKALGKPEVGQIKVNAYHEGGQVIIEISDDGQGLNRERILEKLIEKNLVSAEKGSLLSDREIFNYIFLPGFSTAQAVTKLSGRGVGMDVVKTNLDKIGGAIELESAENKGTCFRMKIPLTLAIVPALVVRAGKEHFAIPQVKLVELVQASKRSGEVTDVRGRIEYLEGKPVFRLRGNLLPLVSLCEVLALKAPEGGASQPEQKDEIDIVILHADGRQFGLIVDEIQDTTDIVVKPLGKFLKTLAVYSGATIMGNGAVALILDVKGVAEAADIFAKKSKGKEADLGDGSGGSETRADIQEYLLFRLGGPSKYSIPLCLVSRLEEFPANAVEHTGEQPVIRYRDAILPLISLKSFLRLELNDQAPREKISVIVVRRNGRSFGIEVEQILDVVQVEGDIDDSLKDRAGILGNFILNDEVVVAIDVAGIVACEMKRLNKQLNFREAERPAEGIDARKNKAIRVLYAEDARFFRNHIARTLEAAGMSVSAVENGQEAIDALSGSSGDQFSLVLSDIEMPKVDGFELARAIRANRKFDNIPLVALTTRFKQSDIEQGEAAGFDLYLEKLSEDLLIEGIEKLVKQRGG
jgi:two-component system chemotaxis sensor kinase CheA